MFCLRTAKNRSFGFDLRGSLERLSMNDRYPLASMPTYVASLLALSRGSNVRRAVIHPARYAVTGSWSSGSKSLSDEGPFVSVLEGLVEAEEEDFGGVGWRTTGEV